MTYHGHTYDIDGWTYADAQIIRNDHKCECCGAYITSADSGKPILVVDRGSRKPCGYICPECMKQMFTENPTDLLFDIKCYPVDCADDEEQRAEELHEEAVRAELMRTSKLCE